MIMSNITENEIYQLIQDAFDSLQRSGLLKETVTVAKDTVLLGKGSVLDSIAFVTLITDLEDRVCDAVDDEVSLVLNEISEFDINKPHLTAEIIANYVVSAVQEL